MAMPSYGAKYSRKDQVNFVDDNFKNMMGYSLL